MQFSVQSLFRWYRDALRNPKYRWWIIVGTVVYLLIPFDVVPDFFPLVGEIDDIALVTLLFAEVAQVVVEALKQRQPNSDASQPFDSSTQTVDVESTSLKD